jgi:hypothetical protein
MAAQAGSWERFDVFAVSRLSGGRPLQTITWHLLNRLGVVDKLALPHTKVLNFLRVSISCGMQRFFMSPLRIELSRFTSLRVCALRTDPVPTISSQIETWNACL